MATELPLARLKVDPLVHARTRIRAPVVRAYQAAARDRAGLDEMPPLVAFRDAQGDVWLSDGFHRYYAWQRAGHESVPVEIHEGDRRAAVLFACGANTEHGLPRSRRDKWACVAKFLADPEWAVRDDAWIAETCAVSRGLVAKVRRSPREPQGASRGWVGAPRSSRKARAVPPTTHPSDDVETEGEDFPPATEPAASALRLTGGAEQALARAQAAATAAHRALVAAERAYPEALHLSAIAVLAEARADLEELVDEEAGVVSWEDNQPATKRAHEFQPATKRADSQPATKQRGAQPVSRSEEWLKSLADGTGSSKKALLRAIDGLLSSSQAESCSLDPFERLAEPPPAADPLDRFLTGPPPPLLAAKPPPADLIRQKKKDRKQRERARRAAERARR